MASRIFGYMITNDKDVVFDLTNEFVLFLDSQNLITLMDFSD